MNELGACATSSLFYRLNFGLIAVTMFVSMWISNTAAVAMMIPIMQAVLEELEAVRLATASDNRQNFLN